MKKHTLDHIDYKILNRLQENATIPVKVIAEEVFLSSPAVAARKNKDILQDIMRKSIRSCLDITLKHLSVWKSSRSEKKSFIRI